MAAKQLTGDLTAAQHAAEMADYLEAGRARAIALGNRGPLRLTAEGALAPDILAAYREHGFYVFEHVIDDRELDELRAGIDEMIRRAPVSPGADVDASGRPPLGSDITRDSYLWARPLADPVGGTSANGGRHPAKMVEPEAPSGAPAFVIQNVVDTLLGDGKATTNALEGLKVVEIIERIYDHRPDF